MQGYIYYFPYLIVLTIPLILLYCDYKKNTDIDHKYVFYIYLLFAALRGNGDGDYFSYKNGVRYISKLSDIFKPEDYPFEIGVRIIHYINNFLNIDYQFTIIVLAIISLSTIYFIIDRYSVNKKLSWFLYFPFLLYFDMHHSRTAIAINFTLMFFLKIFIDERPIESIKFFILAFLFHKTSLIPLTIIIVIRLIFKLFDNANFKQENFIIRAIIFTFAISKILTLKNLEAFLIYFNNNSYFTKKFISYFNNNQWTYKFKLMDPRLWVILLLILYSSYLYRKYDKNQKHLYYNIYLLVAILLIFILQESTLLVMRFYNYFNLIIILLLPFLLGLENEHNMKVKKSWLSLIHSFIILYYFIYSILLIWREVPYYFFFIIY